MQENKEILRRSFRSAVQLRVSFNFEVAKTDVYLKIGKHFIAKLVSLAQFFTVKSQ